MDAMTTRPRPKPFVQVRLDWAVAMTKALRQPRAMVALELLYASWKSNGQAVTLPAGRLERAGVDRRTRWRALVKLEVAGLVRIERRRGKPHLVTLVLP